MKPEELRIRNWVNWHDAECQITPEDLLEMQKDDKHNFSPIPLTPEWLERFGFEKIYAHRYGHIKNRYFFRLSEKRHNF